MRPRATALGCAARGCPSSFPNLLDFSSAHEHTTSEFLNPDPSRLSYSHPDLLAASHLSRIPGQKACVTVRGWPLVTPVTPHAVRQRRPNSFWKHKKGHVNKTRLLHGTVQRPGSERSYFEGL